MTYLNRSRWGLGLMALMLLTVGLAGCGSEPAAVARPPAPPPAPPPFQPVAVEVALGENGGTVTLMTTEAGGHTLNGEAFASGTEVEGNGSTYTLTLDGTWSAAYKPPPAMSLALGTTGGELMIERLEDGSYQANGAALASGDTVTAENGNMYTVTISDDGTPSEAYVVPAALSIPLGLSGDTVAIVKNEDGTYSVNGEVLTADTRVEAENGNVYGALLAPDGTPIGVMHIAAMQEVMLGELGGTITLTQAEDKSWWLGEMAVMDGDEYMAANGNTYTLVSDGTTWSAAYTQPPAMSLALGTTGGELMIERLEDGSYQANGAALASGDTVTAENGNMYTVTISDDGTPSEEYVVPAALSIPLGLSGDTAAIVKNEDGTYSVDGEVLTADTRVMAANGNFYGALLAPDGTPAAEAMYIAAMQEVTLGASGGTITLKQGEDKAWWLGEMAVMDGDEHTAGNGNTYVLMMDEAGTWSGMYQAVVKSFELGTQGSITVTRAEDMSWSMDDGMVVMDGDEHTADNGNMYTLSMTDGKWSSAFVPVGREIAGTGLTAYTREADVMYNVGGSDDTLTAGGVGDVTVEGAMYHVWQQDDGMLAGARFGSAIEGGLDSRRGVGDLAVPSLTGKATKFDLSADDADTVGSELRTHLVVDGVSFAIADLLGGGTASMAGDNFVAKAAEKISEQRGKVATLLSLKDSLSGDALDKSLQARWTEIHASLNTIFGGNRSEALVGTNDPGEDDILDEIDDILAALASPQAFTAATAEDGDGVFEDAELSTDKAEAAFDQVMSSAAASFGATGSTRYGTILKKTTPTAVTDLKYAYDAAGSTGALGAFSYSTLEETLRTSHIVSTTGNAYYTGGTHALSNAGDVYTGQIDVQVRFSSKKVSGLVTRLADSEGALWKYLYGDVDTIVLDSDLKVNAKWAGSGDASVTYAARAGSPLPQTIDSTFHGILLGRDAAAGSEANGTWSVGTQGGTYLAGAFGVTRGADTPVALPDPDSGAAAESMEITGGGKIEDGMLALTSILTDEVAGDEVEMKISQKLDLTALLASGTKTYSGPTHVSLAVAEIEKQRTKLAALQGLDDQTLAADEESAWEAVKGVLNSRVFGVVPDKLNKEYDDTDGVKDDALDLIDRALAALASNAALEAALDGDGSGVFKDVDELDGATAPGADKEVKAKDRTAAQIRSEKQYQVLAKLGSTSYTRFGVWRLRDYRDAVRTGGENNRDRNNLATGPDGDDGPGMFAYSQLAPTVIARVNDPGYSPGGSASYVGETVAVQNKTYLTGTVQAAVTWKTDTVGGDLNVTISDLANDNGDMLALKEAEGYATIRDIVFPEISVKQGLAANELNQLVFKEVGHAVRYRFEAIDKPDERGATAGGIDGRFVGRGVDGPVGVIGTWSLDDSSVGRVNDDASELVDLGNVIYGAFGAELP